MAYNSIVRSSQNGTSVPAPDSGTVLNKDPSSLLNRSETEFSPYGSAGEDAYSISSVARMVQDAVVVINASSGRSTSAGSGVIISDKGYILTCNHVVEGATRISVTVNNCANPYLAATVGTDSGTDLAVLKIEPLESEPLTAATHGILSREKLINAHAACGEIISLTLCAEPIKIPSVLTVVSLATSPLIRATQHRQSLSPSGENINEIAPPILPSILNFASAT